MKPDTSRILKLLQREYDDLYMQMGDECNIVIGKDENGDLVSQPIYEPVTEEIAKLITLEKEHAVKERQKKLFQDIKKLNKYTSIGMIRSNDPDIDNTCAMATDENGEYIRADELMDLIFPVSVIHLFSEKKLKDKKGDELE